MSRLNQILILAVALAAILLFFAFGKIRKQKAEIDRLDWNIEAVNTKAMQYKSTAGDYAERVNTLTLEKSELEMFNADLNNKVRDSRDSYHFHGGGGKAYTTGRGLYARSETVNNVICTCVCEEYYS